MKPETKLGLRLAALAERASGVATGSVTWDSVVKAYAEAAGITEKQATRQLLKLKGN